MNYKYNKLSSFVKRMSKLVYYSLTDISTNTYNTINQEREANLILLSDNHHQILYLPPLPSPNVQRPYHHRHRRRRDPGAGAKERSFPPNDTVLSKRRNEPQNPTLQHLKPDPHPPPGLVGSPDRRIRRHRRVRVRLVGIRRRERRRRGRRRQRGTRRQGGRNWDGVVQRRVEIFVVGWREDGEFGFGERISDHHHCPGLDRFGVVWILWKVVRRHC